MNLRPSQLERYFVKYEFSRKYLLSSSDCDGLSQSEAAEPGPMMKPAVFGKTDAWGYTESLGTLC